MTFSFDERYLMFDVTPVDNQFILEYLPEARGDDVRVYLYGLMGCYYPMQEGLTLERMSQDLHLSEEEIRKSYRYWERRGLVRRVQDAPPRWVYVNLKQAGAMPPAEDPDPDFTAFAEAIYDVFDNGRRLHGAEVRTCYDWVEELKLPQEAVIMLLRHMARVKGKDFSIKSADKVAAQMADEKIRTVEEAEEFLSRDMKTYEALRRVLRKLGKRGYPSEAQLDLYRKWRDEWHFTPDAIEQACALTAKGEPSIGYLNGILEELRKNTSAGETITAEDIAADQARGDRLREVLRRLSGGRMTAENKALMAEIETMYPLNVILIAAGECSQSGKNLQDLRKLLLSWQDKGLRSEEEVREYVARFHRTTEVLRSLRDLWNGSEPGIGEANRQAVSRWMDEYGFSREMILFTAGSAAEARKPMAYLDKILTVYQQQGIRTPEEAENARKRFLDQQGWKEQGSRPAAGGKTVPGQQYEQRDYSRKQKEMMDLFIRLNGGEPDA